MKYVLLFMAFVGAASVWGDVGSRAIDGKRGYHNGVQAGAQFGIPCDSTEGTTLSANLTPVVVQFTASIIRKGTIQNSGAQIVRYRKSQWGLPSDWATVYESVPAASSKEVDLSGMRQLWAWSAAAQTPSPSYAGCFAVNAEAYVPTITPTVTPTVTPTATPTA